MTPLVTILAFAVAAAAAVRSTWSPCGWSMLSTITPLGERGRGRRYAASARWFVLGAVLGGVLLGAVMAGLAVAVGGLHLGATPVAIAVAVAALVAAASDACLGPIRIPIHRRQVNEMWLDHYRPWVYAGGFGIQIGCGLATYITTAGIYLMIALVAASGSPVVALCVGTAFGLVRGLAVFASRGCTTPALLHVFHRRFEAAGRTSRLAVIAVQSGVAVVALATVNLAGAGVLGGVVAFVAGGTVWSRRNHRSAPTGDRDPASGSELTLSRS